jgi:fimbrial isopeptide formation D2 family protein/LPXTG-motif cell wall-anchored protein
MKRLKKTLALALALILTLAMSTAVLADENEGGGDETYTITITNSASGHTYEAYQIFKGDLTEKTVVDETSGTKTTRTLSNVKWGSGVTKVGSTDVVEGTSASEAAEALEGKSADDVKTFIDSLVLGTAAGKSTPSTEKVNGAYTYTISGLAAGYYVVKDQDKSLQNKDDAYTSYIVEVVGNVTTEAKSSATTSQKKVQDVNDSEADSTTGWQDSADYDIGDKVPFQLTATITDKYTDYKSYYLVFHDNQAEGLSFDKDSVYVYVVNNENGKESITDVDAENYSVETTGLSDGDTFEIVFNNLKDIKAVQAGSKVVVEYKSELNKKAKLGAEGNKNKMHIQYSNNPNATGDGKTDTGETPDDTVIVFTYKVVINKADQNSKPLKGAEFTLYKKDPSVKEDTKGYKEFNGSYYKIIEKTSLSENGATFSFEGIDDGDYILSETTTPKGYNTVADMSFTVKADHDIESDTPALQGLNGNKTDGTIYTDISEKLTPNISAGSLTAEVINNAGSTLPSTGGTGRILLYVIGAILVVGVGVILVSKKRAQQ